MRNLKKFLALVLALMMVMSVMVTVSAAADYTDEGDIKANYSEAIDVMTALGVFQGRGEAGDSEFDPKGTLNRAEAAKIVAYMMLGSAAANLPTAAVYTDVPTTYWGNRFVNWASLKEIIDPANEKFRPTDPVTGYEFGKMVLVAAGFDPDQYTDVGAAWTQNVAVDVAKLTGSTGYTLETGDLSSDGIHREAAAQLAFSVLRYGMGDTYYKVFNDTDKDGIPDGGEVVLYEGTDYNLAMLYAQSEGAVVNARKDTLGSKVFGLTLVDPYSDQWGHPSRLWTATMPNVRVPYAYTPVAKFTVAKDECDVIDEFDIEEGYIGQYWVNGVAFTDARVAAATTGGDAFLDEQGVGEEMGGQGVQTFIYRIGTFADGKPIYRVVRIDTYLAEVTAVHPQTTDKNGHTTKRTVDLAVYNAPSGIPNIVREYESETLVRGQYVTLNIDASAATLKAGLNNVTPATVLTSGALANWTDKDYPNPATVTVNMKDWPEAEKFYMNRHNTNVSNWAFLSDGMGNVIGQGTATYTYAVLTDIVWVHTGLTGGHAEANLITVDGKLLNGVTVKNLNGAAAKNADAIIVVNGANEYVYDNVANNAAFYANQIVTYSVNEDDGTYNIATHAYTNDPNVVDNGGAICTITQTQANIYDTASLNGATRAADGPRIVARGTDQTVYLVEQADGTYKTYVGKNNVPTTTGKVCILKDDDGYAVLVVVSGVTGTSNQFVAFVNDLVRDGSKNVAGVVYNCYRVYTVGSYTEAKNVYIDPGAAADGWNTVTAPGLYQFTVNAQGDVIATTPVLNAATNVGAVNNVNYAVATANAAIVGNTLLTTLDDQSEENFNIRDTEFVKVNMNNTTLAAATGATLTKGSVSDITTGTDLFVVYDKVGNNNFASCVYILVPNRPSVTTPSLGTVVLSVTSVDSGEVDFVATWTPGAGYTATGRETMILQYKTVGSTTWTNVGTMDYVPGTAYSYDFWTDVRQGQTLEFRAVLRASVGATENLRESAAVSVYIP